MKTKRECLLVETGPSEIFLRHLRPGQRWSPAGCRSIGSAALAGMDSEPAPGTVEMLKCETCPPSLEFQRTKNIEMRNPAPKNVTVRGLPTLSTEGLCSIFGTAPIQATAIATSPASPSANPEPPAAESPPPSGNSTNSSPPPGQIVNRAPCSRKSTATATLLEDLSDLDNLNLQFDSTESGQRFIQAWQRACIILDAGHGHDGEDDGESTATPSPAQ